jgi:PEP-CTERM motif
LWLAAPGLVLKLERIAMKFHLNSRRAARAALLASVLAAAGASSAWASLTVATSRGDVTADSTINWGALGGDFTPVGATATVGAVSVSGAPAFGILEQGLSATYNFAAGESLLAMFDLVNGTDTNGNFVLAFAGGIAGFGTQIQGNLFGALSVDMDVFDTANLLIGSFNFVGTSGGNNDGSALFVGVNSTALDIGRIVLRGAGAGAAINQLTLDTVANNGVPEPGTLALAGLALAAASTLRRRQG